MCNFLRREIFIELPSADRESGGAKVGSLDEGVVWCKRCSIDLCTCSELNSGRGLGFSRIILHPSFCIHDSEELLPIVHVDDVLISGHQEALQCLRRSQRRSMTCVGPSATGRKLLMKRCTRIEDQGEVLTIQRAMKVTTGM